MDNDTFKRFKLIENLINKYVEELLTSDEGVRLDLINTFFERLVIYLEKTPNKVFKSENLASFVSHKLIPNDFRTRMYLELNTYENSTIKKALKNKLQIASKPYLNYLYL